MLIKYIQVRLVLWPIVPYRLWYDRNLYLSLAEVIKNRSQNTYISS